MDMDLKQPSLESFFSPNHQPHSLSTIWDDKNKEEEVDPSTSDMDDQSSYQEKEEDVENGHEINSHEYNMHDLLEWKNGVGTLAGSDLKFRIDENGDIEVITDMNIEKMQEEDSSAPLENNTDDNHAMKMIENGETSDDPHTNSENENFETHSPNSSMTKEKDTSKAENNQNGCGNGASIFEHINDRIKDYSERSPPHTGTPERTSDNIEIKDIQDKIESSSKRSDESFSPDNLDDNLMDDDDPVLKEDAMLFDDVDRCDTFSPETLNGKMPEPDDELKNSSDYLDLNMCEICGKPSVLANRFCSRQCLGRNAAIQRRANMSSSVVKKTKHGRKKNGTRNSFDRMSPYSKDVLTVVHDETTKKNDLKIKIRWSSASTDNQDEYFPDSRESVKRRYTSTGSNDGGAATRTGGRQREFSWPSYLQDENAVAATPEIFNILTENNFCLKENKFNPGMVLEGVDPEHESLICSLVVAETHGGRIRLSFCGYSESYDFWRNVNSALVFPCGFCKETGRTLEPPKGFASSKFVWEEYVATNGLNFAPRECFHKPMNGCCAVFEVGQKFEAVDKHNPDLTCVATVQDVLNDQLLVHFDGWSHDFDYWCSFNSQFIHLVGWCKQNEKMLTPPEGYKTGEKFDWNSYLSDTKSHRIDEKSVCTKTYHEFTEGMRMEVVDPRNKQLIRVASIAEVIDFKIKIHFDGWSDMYDFWTTLENSDLHPVGWCEKTRHHLESPVLLDDIEDSWQTGGCPIPGCTGVGHIQGAKYMNHYSEFGCPYSPQNLTKDLTKDRLAVRKPRRSRSAVIRDEEPPIEIYNDADFNEEEVISRQTSPKGITRKRNSNTQPQYATTTPEKKRTRANAEATPDISDLGKETVAAISTADVIAKWTVEDVARFIDDITNQPIYGNIFRREEIDGEAILMLTQSDILQILKIKLGPAVKIYNAIILIREAE